jgi:hypothetical protein
MINVWNYCFEGYASQARNGGLRVTFLEGLGAQDARRRKASRVLEAKKSKSSNAR